MTPLPLLSRAPSISLLVIATLGSMASAARAQEDRVAATAPGRSSLRAIEEEQLRFRPPERPTHLPEERPTHLPEERPTHLPEERPTHLPEERPTHLPEERPTHLPEERPTHLPEERPASVPEEHFFAPRADDRQAAPFADDRLVAPFADDRFGPALRREPEPRRFGLRRLDREHLTALATQVIDRAPRLGLSAVYAVSSALLIKDGNLDLAGAFAYASLQTGISALARFPGGARPSLVGIAANSALLFSALKIGRLELIAPALRATLGFTIGSLSLRNAWHALHPSPRLADGGGRELIFDAPRPSIEVHLGPTPFKLDIPLPRFRRFGRPSEAAGAADGGR